MSNIYDQLIELPIEDRIKVIEGLDRKSQILVLDELQKKEKEQCRDLRMFVKYAWQNTEAEPFIPNWHIDAICDHLQAMSEGHIRKLIINIPPRSMKSLSACVFWPAWEWGEINPAQKWIFASHAQNLATDMSVKCRSLIASDWYQAHWGDKVAIREDENKKMHYVNTSRGERLSTSVGSGITGFGGNRLVVDDPINADKAESSIERSTANSWWSETMSTRLNNPAIGTKLIIMQRLHEYDLTGYCLAQEQGYEHLCLPMRFERDHPHKSKTSLHFIDPRTEDGELLFPARVPEDSLQELEASMGSYSVAGQLQQRPAPRDSGMFKREWFGIVDSIPNRIKRVVRHWDLASTEKRSGNDPDWTVGLKLVLDAKGVFYVTDIQRFRESSQYVEDAIKSTALQDGKNTIISLPQDPGQAGKVQANYYKIELAGNYANKIIIERESGNKAVRAQPVEAQAEAGNIKLVRGNWNDAFLSEIDTFPNGRYKDQVDALSGAFGVLNKYRKAMGTFKLADLGQKSTFSLQ